MGELAMLGEVGPALHAGGTGVDEDGDVELAAEQRDERRDVRCAADGPDAPPLVQAGAAFAATRA